MYEDPLLQSFSGRLALGLHLWKGGMLTTVSRRRGAVSLFCVVKKQLEWVALGPALSSRDHASEARKVKLAVGFKLRGTDKSSGATSSASTVAPAVSSRGTSASSGPTAGTGEKGSSGPSKLIDRCQPGG